ncbi:hypothetical protein Hdeb2414_s0041g00736711 [Helianthus debilis subsp. tardiflorus]
MSFYGIAGLFISSYLWCTISWNVGSLPILFTLRYMSKLVAKYSPPLSERRDIIDFLVCHFTTSLNNLNFANTLDIYLHEVNPHVS